MCKKLFTVLIGVFLFCTACNVVDIPGQKANSGITFSFTDATPQQNSNIAEPVSADIINAGTAQFILASVKTESGTAVFTNRKIKLINFYGNYISEVISLETGSYNITDFAVLDSSHNVIYAAPKKGSAKEGLVSKPLSHTFTAAENVTTNVAPEVIKVENGIPSDYGYTTFNFKIADTFLFLIETMIHGAVTLEKTTADISISGTKSDTNITAVLYTGNTTADQNQIQLASGYDNYTITISKIGYIIIQKNLTESEIKLYSANPFVQILEKKIFHEAFPITGKVNVLTDEATGITTVYIIQNWVSKSQIRLQVISDIKKFYDPTLNPVLNLNGKIVSVNGNIVQLASPFSGTIDVTGIVSVSEYNPAGTTVPGQFLVKLDEGYNESIINSTFTPYIFVNEYQTMFDINPLYLVKFSEPYPALEELQAKANGVAGILTIQPNYIFQQNFR